MTLNSDRKFYERCGFFLLLNFKIGLSSCGQRPDVCLFLPRVDDVKFPIQNSGLDMGRTFHGPESASGICVQEHTLSEQVLLTIKKGHLSEARFQIWWFAL